MLHHLDLFGCVLVPHENERYTIIRIEEGIPAPDTKYTCTVFNSECDSDFAPITVGTPEEAIEAHVCTLCHVLEGDGSCCGCLEIQRDQGRYEGLWDDDEHPDT
jgi:hypothetical protein